MEELEKLIEQYCPKGVPKVALGECIDIKTGDQLNKSMMLVVGDYPVINGGINPSGYTDKYNTEANTSTISQGGNSAGYVNWLKSRFWAGAHCFVVRPKKGFDNRFVYHFLKQSELSLMMSKQGAGIPSVGRKTILSLEMPFPSLPVQHEIVRVLDTFTNLNENLQQELDARGKQLEYYRNAFFGSSVEEMLCKAQDGSFKVVPISSLGSLTRGKRFVKADSVDIGAPCIHYGEIYTYYGLYASETKSHISYEQTKLLRHAQKNDVIIVGAGENNVDIGIGVVWLGDEEVAVHDACYTLHHSQNPLYISNYLRSQVYHQQIKKDVSEGKICSISAQGVGRALIPIPSLSKQAEIVDKLGAIEGLIQNIKDEIAARQKQYEYYREKLLTF